MVMKYIHSLFPEVCQVHFLLPSVSQSRLHSLTVLVPALTTPPSSSFLRNTCFREHRPSALTSQRPHADHSEASLPHATCSRLPVSYSVSACFSRPSIHPSPAPSSPSVPFAPARPLSSLAPCSTPAFTSSRVGLPPFLRIPSQILFTLQTFSAGFTPVEFLWLPPHRCHPSQN